MSRFARLAAIALCAVLGAAGSASAQYPTRPVKIIVSYPPGGTTDVLARLIAQWLSDKTGQAFIVENKPGGGNNIGTDYALKQPADGYTLFLTNPANGINHTLYKNLPFNILTDLIGGQVHVLFDNLPSSIGHIKGGRIRAFAVTTTTRSPSLPDVPTVADTVPGYEASAWFGLGMPKGSPKEAIDRINAEVNRALADPTFSAKLADLGGTTLAGTPEDFGKVIASEVAKWEKVVKASGAKVE